MDNRKYGISQNFTVSSVLLGKLNALIAPKTSTALDIGAGKGTITTLLANKYPRVIAFEPDHSLFAQLKNRFPEKVTVLKEEFSEKLLPIEPYSVISNIPFRYTSQIMGALLKDENFQDGLIIMQKEAAEKIGGKQLNAKRTYLSSIYEFDFSIEIALNCVATDFHPVPNVSIVVINITRRAPLLPTVEERVSYLDFVAYAFNRSVPIISKAFPTLKYAPLGKKVISDLTTNELLELFNLTKSFANTYRGYAQKLRYEQMTVQKIFRTRNAKDWKSKRYSTK